MENKFTDQEVKEVQEHVEEICSAIVIAKRGFLKVIDPSETPETMDYVRKVSYAFDNVILTIFNSEDDDNYRDMIRKSSDEFIQYLVDYHNEEKQTH